MRYVRHGETKREAYQRGVETGIGYCLITLSLLAMGFTIGVMI